MVEENYKLGEYDIYYRSGFLADSEKEEAVIEKLKQVQGVKEKFNHIVCGAVLVQSGRKQRISHRRIQNRAQEK